jgi:hypothetical protein
MYDFPARLLTLSQFLLGLVKAFVDMGPRRMDLIFLTAKYLYVIIIA